MLSSTIHKISEKSGYLYYVKAYWHLLNVLTIFLLTTFYPSTQLIVYIPLLIVFPILFIIWKEILIIKPIDVAIAILLIVEFFNYLNSFYSENSIIFTLNIYVFGICYFSLRVFEVLKNHKRILLWSCSIIGSIMSLKIILAFLYGFAILQGAFENQDLTQFKNLLSPTGGMTNHISTVILFLMVNQFILFDTELKKFKNIIAFFLLLSIVALILTFSRGIYISLIFFLVMILILKFCYDKKSFFETLKLALTLGLLATVLLAYWYDSIFTVFSLFENESQIRSFNGRLWAYKFAFEIYKSTPVFGVGSGNFLLVSASHQYNLNPHGISLFVTNSYLQLLAEKGVAGILTYGYLMIVVLHNCYINVIKKREYLFITLGVGFLTLMMRELSFSSIFEVPSLLFVFFINTYLITGLLRTNGK